MYSTTRRNYIIFIVAIAIAIIAVVAAAILLTPNHPGNSGPKVPPEIQVTLPTTSGIATATLPLSIKVDNYGGDAAGVRISLSSNAFGNLQTEAVDIPSGSEKIVAVNAKINDVTTGEYAVTLNYSFEGMDEPEDPTSATFYVLPAIEITDVHWTYEDFFGYHTR